MAVMTNSVVMKNIIGLSRCISKMQPKSIVFGYGLLKTLTSATKDPYLPRERLINTIRTENIRKFEPYPINYLTDTCIKTQNIKSLNLLSLRRCFHNTNVDRFQVTRNNKSSFYENGGPPPPPIRVFRISPFMLIVGTCMSMALFLMIIPILFKLLFPIVIIGIGVYQLNTWKSNRFYQNVMRKLPTSTIKVSYKTLNSLQYRFFPSSLIKTFNVNVKDADAMMEMVQNRIVESFNENEHGIRNYFFPGRNNIKQFDDMLKLNIVKSNTYGRKIDEHLIMSMKYPLMYVNDLQNKHFANIIITILDDSFQKKNSFKSILELAKTNETCRMVICVQSVGSLIPQEYIISTPGETGTYYDKYDIKTRPDGHREFTIHNDN